MGTPITQIEQHPRRVITITIGHLINDIGISKANRDILEQIEAAFGDVNMELIDITTNIHLGNEDAYQEFWLTASDLEDSTDPDGNVVANSVLLTQSQTAVEFDWPRTFRQNCTVQIGPGDNVQDHAFVQNLDFNIDGFYVRGVSAGVFELKSRRAVVMPYFGGGSRLKLWIGQFQYDAAAPNNIRFQPSGLVPDIRTKVILRARPELWP